MTETSLRSLPGDYRAIVFGGHGGLGSAFVEALRADPRCGQVVGLGRRTQPALDLENETSIAAAAEALAATAPIHLLLDATGLLHDDDMAPEKSLDAVEPETIARAFAVNSTGPLLLLKHFRHMLPREGRGVFATLSARVGSITDNGLGGWYGYRASKAALNMFLRTASIEIARKRPQAVCLALHPGTVRTQLSDPFSGRRERLEPEQSAALLLEVIDRAGRSGMFLAHDGSEIPW